MQAATRAAICRIDIMQGGASVARGTGALVADGLVLTAFHVIGNRMADPPAAYAGEIRVTFPSGATTGTLHARCFDARADWAMVQLTDAPAVRPIPLSSLAAGGVQWETYGFPDANPRDGMVQAGSVVNDRGELENSRVLRRRSVGAGTLGDSVRPHLESVGAGVQ